MLAMGLSKEKTRKATGRTKRGSSHVLVTDDVLAANREGFRSPLVNIAFGFVFLGVM